MCKLPIGNMKEVNLGCAFKLVSPLGFDVLQLMSVFCFIIFMSSLCTHKEVFLVVSFYSSYIFITTNQYSSEQPCIVSSRF